MSPDWVEPGPHEELPGVHRIPLPLRNDGLRAVNVYALVSDGDLVLIDAGWAIPEARQALVDALDRLGRSPADISRFLVTHIHRDHYTQAVALRREFGATVYLGAGERTSLEMGIEATTPALLAQFRALARLGATDLLARMQAHLPDGGEEDFSGDWELPDVWLHGQSLLRAGARTLTAVPTPGHTNGHMVFHDVQAAALFSGDHVLPHITPSIGFDAGTSANPLGDFLASLALVRSRPDAVLLPAHGPVLPSVHARVDELVAHHGGRLEETEKAVAAGCDTGIAVAGQLGWTRRNRRFDELDLVNSMFAVCETGAHLDLLVAQGRIAAEDLDGVRHYRIA